MNPPKRVSRLRQEFLVRHAPLRDLEVLVRHRRGMWKDVGIRTKSALDEADQVYRRWAKAGLKKRNLLGWIAETNGGVAVGSGCIWLQPRQPRPNHKEHVQPYLLSMYTEPRFRRKGVASRVLKEAINWCRKSGYSSLALHASRYGRRLYSRHGFTRNWQMRLNLERKSRR